MVADSASDAPMPSARFELHVEAKADGERAAVLLADASGLSRQRIKTVMQRGAVWLTDAHGTRRLRRQDRSLKSADRLHLYYDEKVLEARVPPAQLIADQGAYSVWYKPFGMLSQGSKWGDHCSIARWVELHLSPQRPVFIVHRLDRAATGLILLAHGKKVAAALARLFEARETEKRYRVIVHGRFPAGDEPLALDTPLDGRAARSHARLLRHDPERDRSLLEVRIDTGRKHQIRRHLAGLGFPLVGDRLYGRGANGDDLKLAACLLAFVCPVTGERRTFELPERLKPVL